jgi:hypothetical protein
MHTVCQMRLGRLKKNSPLQQAVQGGVPEWDDLFEYEPVNGCFEIPSPSLAHAGFAGCGRWCPAAWSQDWCGARGRSEAISFLPRNSCANHPASCTTDCPHNLKPFGLLLRQALALSAERLDGDCVPTAKMHLRPETAPGIAKISNACPLHEWVTSDVNSGDLNLGIYEKALTRSAFHGVYNQWGLFVFGQSSSMIGENICIASAIPKESAANHGKLFGHS